MRAADSWSSIQTCRDACRTVSRTKRRWSTGATRSGAASARCASSAIRFLRSNPTENRLQAESLPHNPLERLEGAAVLHQIRRGGGAEGAEPLEQAEHEKDQRFVSRRHFDRTAAALEGAVLERAAEVERHADEGFAEILAKGFGIPHRTGGEEAGENRAGTDGRVFGAAGDDSDRSAAQGSNRRGFFVGLANPLARKRELNLKLR